MVTNERFNEETLYGAIVSTWGEWGAHADVFRTICKQNASLREEVQAERDLSDRLIMALLSGPLAPGVETGPEWAEVHRVLDEWKELARWPEDWAE